MKKIMFNDKYGLTDAVLEGRKTMTRRIVPTQYVPLIEDGMEGAALIEAQSHGDAYRKNEVVAVAQAYKDIIGDDVFFVSSETGVSVHRAVMEREKGWSNKMFVRTDLMSHQIRITDIKVERLQDISDEDCMKEGIIRRDDLINSRMENTVRYTFENSFVRGVWKSYATPKEAFAALIDRVNGKGTWERNPWVFVYSFERVK